MAGNEWIVVTVLMTLLTIYNIIITIKDRNSKPLKDLERNFINLDKTVNTLSVTIKMFNDTMTEYIDSNSRRHASFAEDIKSCNDKISEHETRITILERTSERD